MNSLAYPRDIASARGGFSWLAWALPVALLATVLDLAVATLYFLPAGVSPLRVMQAVAAHWGWGRAAYAGGVAMAALGAGLLFARMVLLAGMYRFAARRHSVLVEHPYVCGALFGLAVYAFNRFLMVPLIAAMPPPAHGPELAWTICCIAAHMTCIGMVLALAARKSLQAEAR